jgi:lysophospholipase L1-like esterase
MAAQSNLRIDDTKSKTIACLGSSTVASKGTFKWIDELAKREQNKEFHFVNLGVGGDLAYSALQRLPDVVACKPDKVIIIIGSNDVLALVFKNVKRFFSGWKQMPDEVSPESFKKNLEAIVNRLKEETSAKIGLTSLSQIGEDPNPINPIQKELNERIKQYNQIIKKVSEEHGVSYIPFYERMHEQIVASPGRAFISFSILALYKDYLLREFILRRSFDEIAKMNGYQFHIDGIHLNTRGGMILANVVQEFLQS